MLEDLHDKETPLALIEALREATRKYYGAVGYQYLQLLKDHASSTALAESLTADMRKVLVEFAGQYSGFQVERVARRFALVGLAGEQATKDGLTGWNKGEATKAAAACLMSFMNVFGDRGNREERPLLAQVRAFFEANGASRFENTDGNDGQRIINRCGFYRVVESELNTDGKPMLDPSGNPVPKKGGLREFVVLPKAFRKELCAGFDHGFAVSVLKEHQWLIPGKDKTSQSLRLPGMGKTRAYVMSGGSMYRAFLRTC
jgi:putative DNA primase/helicase